MTKKQAARSVKIVGLVHQLDALADEMAYAMAEANLSYVAERGMTPRMNDILMRYQMFAIEAVKEGL